MSEAPDRTIRLDGPCAFLFCSAEGPHDHPVCGKCGAVRFGNIYCDRCREQHRLYTMDVIVGVLRV